ncbi:hypothetical protein Bpfe_011888 [Biomphalaria pfeifferi]|uniref:Uncharacterized protein n=1 Tax=Biomphalaria pfeifferi TaxID=112525 RepID=A0AAD8BQW6_BIOPF|nr:hypothetical protein Bpfe_011888 [Biomphalaria pfeifferi]
MLFQIITGIKMSSNVDTRAANKCPVFGHSCEMVTNVLPTYMDMMKYSVTSDQAKEPVVSEIAEIVATDIEAVWHNASIPVVSHTRILKLIRNSHDELRKLMKPFKERKADNKYLLKLQEYADKSRQKLFDIAICKCVPGNCGCAKPPQEEHFLQDQRTLRIMFIGSVDRVSSAKLKKHYDRKLKEDSRAKKAPKLDLIDQCPGVIDLNNDDSSDAEIGLDEDLSQTEAESNTMITDTETPTSSKPSSSQMRRKLPKLAKICDRFTASDRVGAAVATAVLEDFGIGCDGTATNTGPAGGIIRLLEIKLGRPLQWLPCLLHANELPLCHLIKHLDGKTTGPQGFSGPIGSALLNCELQPVYNFVAISSSIPDVSLSELSTDQRYLHEMCLSVMTGCCSEELARRNPGKMAHSRWLTTAKRILRLYISQQNPTHSLQMLATYIMQV